MLLFTAGSFSPEEFSDELSTGGMGAGWEEGSGDVAPAEGRSREVRSTALEVAETTAEAGGTMATGDTTGAAAAAATSKSRGVLVSGRGDP